MSRRLSAAPARALIGLRRRAGAVFIDGAFRSLSRLGQLHPQARPERHGVEVVHDVPYDPADAEHHRLDVYRPRERGRALPVVLYVHGGGFRILSKDTHWVMGLAFARRDFVVFSINYRLAPAHRFPAAVEDTCRALAWVVRHAAAWGGDPTRLVLAGESAGANLVTALALATSYRRPEPWAAALFDAGIRPRVCLPACGLLQVSDGERFARRRRLPCFLTDRIDEVTRGYLGDRHRDVGHEDLVLADPLLFLERGIAPERPLPGFFIPVGTRDPVLDDSRRLGAALAALGVPSQVVYYPGEVHAFHALMFREAARRCWRDTFAFVDAHLGAGEGVADAPWAPAARPDLSRSGR
jgi:acetyl esterase